MAYKLLPKTVTRLDKAHDKAATWLNFCHELCHEITHLINEKPELFYYKEDDGTYYVTFDYPEYGGLPKRFSNKLGTDDVDIIQEWVGEIVDTYHKIDVSMLFKQLTRTED